jgi:hypothetical protein
LLLALEYLGTRDLAFYGSQNYGGGIPLHLHIERILNAVDHPLKRVICRLNRKHLEEPFNMLFSDTTVANVFVIAGTPLLKLPFPW